MSNTRKFIIGLAVVFIIIGYLFTPHPQTISTPIVSEVEIIDTYDGIDLIRCAKEGVKSLLLSPDSLEFIDTPKMTKVRDNIWLVNGYFEADNSFGAKLRKKYSCNLTMPECSGQCNFNF